MALDLGTAWIQVAPSFSGLKSAVAKEFAGLDPQVSTKSAQGSFSKLAKVAAGTLATVAGGVAALTLKGGIDRALSIEGAQAKLKGLGHDSASVTSIMNSALGSVKGTAYGLGDAATVAASLSAAGVAEGADLTNSLKTVADTAQISGRSLTDIGTIFGSVAARGKLQGDDMLQLMSSGVPVLQFLSKQLHVSSADVSDMVSKGQIDFATFSAAMQAGLGGAAQAGGETFTGAMANARAALSRLGAAIVTPALDGLRQIFNALIPAIDGFTTFVSPLIDLMGSAMSGAAGVAAAALTKIGDGLNAAGRMSTAMTAVVVTVGSAATAMAVYAVATSAATSATGALSVAKTTLNRAMKPFANPYAIIFVALAALVGLFMTLYKQNEQFRNSIQSVADSLQPIFAAVMSTISGLVAQIGPVLAGLISAIGPFFSNIAQAIGGVFSAIGPALSVIMGSIGSVLSGIMGIVGPILSGAFSAIGSVLNAIFGALQPIFAQLGPVFEQLGQTVGQSAGAISAAFGPVGAQLATSFQQIGAALAPLLPMLGQQFGQIVSQLASQLGPLIGQLAGVWAQILPTVVQALGQVAAALAGSLASAISQIVPLLGTVMTQIAGVVAQLLPVILQLVAIVPQLLSQLLPVLLQIIPIILQLVASLLPVLVNIITMLVPIITQIIMAVTPIITMLVSMLVPIIQMITGVILTVINAVMPLITSILPVVSMLIQALIPVITLVINIITAVLQALLPVITTIITLLIPVITTIMNVVTAVITGILTAVSAVIGWFTGTVIPVIQGVVQAIGGAFNWVRDAIGAAWGWIKDQIVAPVVSWFETSVVPRFILVKDSIVDAFNTLKDGIGNAWDAIKNIAKQPVEFIVNTVVAGLVNAYNTVATKFGADAADVPHVEFADGGMSREAQIGNRPILWAEAGPEAYIPLDPAKRTRSLGIWAKTGQMLGALPMADGGILSNIGNFFSNPIESLFGTVKDLITQVGSTPFAQMLAKIPRTIAESIGNWVKEHLGSIFGQGGSGSEAFDGWWNAAVSINPAMAPYKQIAATVAQHESGFNPSIMNNWDSNAAAGHPSGGLMQFIQPTFESNKWPGFDNWLGAVDQLLAWWNYANSRYGGPANIPGITSLAGGGGYVGYAGGTLNAAAGTAWVGENGPELVDFGGGESVYNRSQMDGLEDRVADRTISRLQKMRVSLVVNGHQMGQVIDGRIALAGSTAHGSRW